MSRNRISDYFIQQVFNIFLLLFRAFCGTFLAHSRRMQTVRDQYWRYSLFVLIAGLGTAVFIELTPFFGGLLGASTIYVLLRHQMHYLTELRRWRRSLAAGVLVGEAVLCFLVPIALIVWLLVGRLQHVALDPRLLLDPLKHFAEAVHDKTGYDLWQERNISSVMDYVPRVGQWVVRSLFSFGVNIVVLLFVLYFMLVGGCRMEDYVRELLPFESSVSRSVMREVHMIVRSNAIGIPLLAVIQGAVAYVGYLAFGVSGALFWGLLTCLATVIPIVGTALVWLPLVWLLAVSGNWGQAVGLLLYGGLVITHVDNVVRFVLQKKMADTHPLITIFGVVIGLSLFGFMGVIFGPLMLAMFAFCVNLFKKRYLDGTPDRKLFSREQDDGS